MKAFALRSRFDGRALVLPAVLLAAWYVASVHGLLNADVLVPPQSVARAALHALGSADYWASLTSSLERLLLGFTIGSTAGVAAGITLGVSPLAGALGTPPLNAVRQVALFAWIPLLTAWLGEGETAKVALVALAAFFPAALNTEVGCHHTPRELLEVARVLEFGRWTTLRRVVLPAAVRSIAAGLQIALATAWIGTIGAEYLIDQGTGIGIALSSARLDDRMDLVLVDMATLALVGLALNAGIRRSLARSVARDGIGAGHDD